MSRLPFWLPPNKSLITRPIPVFRVQGYPPDAPETALLLDAFRGSIKQFYLAAAQGYAAGSVPQMARSIDRGDHQIRYVANNGVETVTLKVHPGKVRELVERRSKPWDWALVEIHVPNVPGGTVYGADFRAYRRVPSPNESWQVLDGYCYDQGYNPPGPVGNVSTDSATGVRVMGYPINDPNASRLATVDETSGELVSSLRFDLRTLGWSQIVADLGGYILWSSLAYGIIGWRREAFSTATTTHTSGSGPTPNPAIVYDHIQYGAPDELNNALFYPLPSGPVGYVEAYDTTRRPPPPLFDPNASIIPPGIGNITVSGGSIYTVSYELHNPSGLIQTRVDSFEGPPGTFDIQTTVYDIEAIYGYYNVGSEGESRDAPVKWTAGWGEPPWAKVDHETQDWSWTTWEMTNLYPDRVGFATAGTAHIPPEPEDWETEDELYVQLGAVTIDPKQHTLSFKPA